MSISSVLPKMYPQHIQKLCCTRSFSAKKLLIYWMNPHLMRKRNEWKRLCCECWEAQEKDANNADIVLLFRAKVITLLKKLKAHTVVDSMNSYY